MGCAFLRLLSQSADYDMLVASASERASIDYTLHTTCSRHRNAICPANDSLALSVTEVQGPLFSPHFETTLFEGKV